MDEIIDIPLVDEFTGYEITPDDEFDRIEIPISLVSGSPNRRSLVAIKVKDDSTDALLLKEDLVVIKKTTAQPKNGDFLAYLQDNQINFRYFHKHKNGYKLQTAYPNFKNEEIDSLDKIKIVGKVILVIRNNISELISEDNEPVFESSNQFLVFHNNIKDVIHKKQQIRITQALILLTTIIVAVWLFLNIFNLNLPTWTGFQHKTLWDWLELLIIPAVISFGVFLLNQNQKLSDQIKTEEVTRENALQQYLDKMTELLFGDQRKLSGENSKERNMARTRTLTVLRGLDGERKGIVVKFLYETTLIQGKDKEVVIQLIASDLSYANMSATNLREVNLNGTNLYYANFRSSDLSGAFLQNSFLYGTKLSKANLSDADLSFANLENADLTGADLRRANLIGAKLTKKQLQRAKSIEGAILPKDLASETPLQKK